MTKDEFVAKHVDEMVGLLVSSFAYQENTKAGTDADMQSRGRMMLAQMRRAKEMLGKMFDDMKEKKP